MTMADLVNAVAFSHPARKEFQTRSMEVDQLRRESASRSPVARVGELRIVRLERFDKIGELFIHKKNEIYLFKLAI